MRIKEIEISADHKKPIPEYLTVPEMCLHTSLKALYAIWRRGEINRESAQIEKKKIISKCKNYENDHNCWIEAAKYYQDNIRRAGALLSDIEKSSDIRDVALKACECIGLMTRDPEFLKRQINKFKED